MDKSIIRGLALSGGGYRAAAYHLGTLRKLQEMGKLQGIEKMSTISGGSIIGAFYCLNEDNYPDFENKMYTILTSKDVIRSVFLSWPFLRLIIVALIILALAVWTFIKVHTLLFPVILGLAIWYLISNQFTIFPVSKIIEGVYDEFLYGNKTLKDLSEKRPLLAIGATNLQTARPFVFSKPYMGESYYTREMQARFLPDSFPISRAVMASSCVPFAFTPVSIDKTFIENGKELGSSAPIIVDGGVFDNQGSHKLTHPRSLFRADIIVISDAGNKLPFEDLYKNTISLLIRTSNVFMERIKRFQLKEDVYDQQQSGISEIGYISLGWDLERCIEGFLDNLENKIINPRVIAAHEIPLEWIDQIKKYRNLIKDHISNRVDLEGIRNQYPTQEQVKLARNVTTNLKKLTHAEVEALSAHAAALTELQVKLYCPSL
ncbi:patatin-like phospholipase family protein [Flavihumibacter rivuli]|uniref:patatin-like phospholipase family protein n=1 Tax=Flavihumibacter rivuli TaxID=2838156 RepID=UPI001BDE975F|nr:patatin-like phospholipase family protein [Flavihumibacter rivuli]ULQ55465.1 patatin-like phospholipase family protein [Flavihumibacter rivuli]